ncbi:hypothetical protein [Streptomyces sp. NPDC020917]|uniref:hypothetical protein n=1 Tax=Streptomyces sp. NPDC020917 TaxID=3365102 RepID=UPI0037A6C5DC
MVTHARLGAYHETAVVQANKAFRNAQFAMVAGFALLAVFVVVALRADSTSGSVAAAGLGAVGAALAGYIAKTFVRSQEMTSSAMRSYFDQPLELSRYLAAERLVRGSGLSEDKQAELLHALVHAMVTGSSPASVPAPRAAGTTGE